MGGGGVGGGTGEGSESEIEGAPPKLSLRRHTKGSEELRGLPVPPLLHPPLRQSWGGGLESGGVERESSCQMCLEMEKFKTLPVSAFLAAPEPNFHADPRQETSQKSPGNSFCHTETKRVWGDVQGHMAYSHQVKIESFWTEGQIHTQTLIYILLRLKNQKNESVFCINVRYLQLTLCVVNCDCLIFSSRLE